MKLNLLVVAVASTGLCLVLAAAPAAAEPATSQLATTAQAPTFYPGSVTTTDLIRDCPTAPRGVCNATCECIFCGFAGGFCVYAPLAICDSQACPWVNCGGDYCVE